MQTLLITATDTNAGKTVLTTALAVYWQRHYPCRSLGLMKPIQTGLGDREHYQQHLQLDQPLQQLNPEYFQAPLAPPLAAAREGRSVDLAKVWQTLTTLQQTREWLLVEALGGLGSPVTEELVVADLARDWHLPTVLVVPVKLGAIAQAVANAALARQHRLMLVGLVLNCCHPDAEAAIPDWAPPCLLQSLTQIPVLGHLPYLTDPTNLESLVAAAAGLDLEPLLP